jgi:tyrosine-protein phosphatase YwqE
VVNIGKSLQSMWNKVCRVDIIKEEGNNMKKKRVAFIQSGSGTLTLLIGSETHSVGIDHPNFGKIMQVLHKRDAKELLDLVDVPPES